MALSKTFCFLVLFGGGLVACSETTTGTPTPDPSAVDAGDVPPEEEEELEGGTGETSCTAARQQLLGPVNRTSQAEVKVVEEQGGVKKIYVDAAAGGQAGASRNPRVYVDLSTGTRVDLTDPAAFTSTAWDLALKRTVIYTNGGDGGAGQGGAVDARKGFEAVTAADASKVAAEKFFDDECNPQTDQIGGPATTFAEWYDYNQSSNGVSPRNTTYVVRGGTGKLFKVKILSFTANPDGTTDRAATGYFLLDVAEL